MQTKQHIYRVNLTFIRKMVLLLLPVYNCVAVHNSVIHLSTGTTKGWGGGGGVASCCKVQDQKPDSLLEAHGFDH